MNLLAHALLACSTLEDSTLEDSTGLECTGALMADYFTGQNLLAYPPGIQTGIRQHRDIDAFTDHHRVFREYRQAIATAGAPRFTAGMGAAIIPDMSWHHHFPGCSTPPWQLDGAIQWLKSCGLAGDSIHVVIPESPGIRSDMGPVLNRLTPVV
ncbi:MAG: hypothetical protein ABIJ86_12595, partial [Spirochaetota bacterium]